MKTREKETARTLRRQGLSMNQIVQKTGFSKTSVSSWTRNIVLTDSQRKGISQRGRSRESIERRRLNRLSNAEKKRRSVIELAKRDFSKISQHELKLIGAMLYWGEGRKAGNWTASIANSDPKIIKIMMRFFREICLVPEDKFRAHIHTFEGAEIKKSIEYWSQVASIPKEQFYKTYIKPSKAGQQKRKTLPYGTLDVYVNDTKIFLTIKGWIEGVAETLLSSC